MLSDCRPSAHRCVFGGADAGADLPDQLAMLVEREAVIAAEFVDVDSGRKSDLLQLAAALVLVRAVKAVVAVAKTDRLARDAGFVLNLAN